MAKFLDKFLISTGMTSRRKNDLSCEHITTSDFMRLGVSYYHNMVPNEKLDVNFRAFSRLASMPVPTFGRANMNIRCFFVPFRTIMPSWNDFITDAIHVFSNGTASLPSRVRSVSNLTLVDVLNAYAVDGSADDYDFVHVTSDGNNYRKFTQFSRDIYKLLVSLGYAINWNVSGDDAGVYLSALPILSLLKVYADWYWPSAYVGDPDYDQIQGILSRDVENDVLTTAELQLSLSWLQRVCYDSDYFVSAFDNPTGPVSSVSSSVSISDPSSGTGVSVGDSSLISATTPHINSSSTSVRTLTQFGIESLKKLTLYMRRHQLAGARALDRYLARFGVTLSSDKMMRSVYLGNHQIPLMTGDVMATANTFDADTQKGSPIGSYAGKGFLVGKDGHFSFETDEYGLFIILHSIVPEVGYYQGIDRHNLHTTRLDFFTPEFDAMGTRAISSAELLCPDNPTGNNWRSNFASVFGYTPQYSEYKIGRDWLSGDYRVRSLSVAGDTSNSWHLFRDVRGNEVAPLVHSRGFVQGGVDDDQYDRIFYNTRNNIDHFYLHFFFGVTSFAPMRPLYDTLDFDDEDGAKKVLDVNGVKMN